VSHYYFLRFKHWARSWWWNKYFASSPWWALHNAQSQAAKGEEDETKQFQAKSWVTIEAINITQYRHW